MVGKNKTQILPSENFSIPLEEYEDENKCILNYDINYLSIGGKLYNSYSNITAILNDEFPLEVDKDNKENNFIWNDIYKTDTFVARLKMDNIPLKQGENKITVSSNNKADSLLFYYNKIWICRGEKNDSRFTVC